MLSTTTSDTAAERDARRIAPSAVAGESTRVASETHLRVGRTGLLEFSVELPCMEQSRVTVASSASGPDCADPPRQHKVRPAAVAEDGHAVAQESPAVTQREPA